MPLTSTFLSKRAGTLKSGTIFAKPSTNRALSKVWLKDIFNRCPFEIWVPLIGALQAFVVRKTSGNVKLSQKFLFLRIDVTTDWQNTFHTAILLSLITELIFLSKGPSDTKINQIQHQKGW